MSLKLVLWHDEQNNKLNRRVIQRVKLDSGGGTPESGHDFVQLIGRTMRNGNAKSDTGAHGFLPLFQGSQNAVSSVRPDLAETDKQIDQLDDGRPPFGCLHLGNDLLDR